MKIRFETKDGEVVEVPASPGERLLDAGQRVGMPLEGTCEGQMACATCHVIVASEHFSMLPEAAEEEEDMLDLAPHAARTSRLSCQIVLTSACDGLTVRIP